MKVALLKDLAISTHQNDLLAKIYLLMTFTLREELGSTLAAPSFLSAGYWPLRTCLVTASFSCEFPHWHLKQRSSSLGYPQLCVAAAFSEQSINSQAHAGVTFRV